MKGRTTLLMRQFGTTKVSISRIKETENFRHGFPFITDL